MAESSVSLKPPLQRNAEFLAKTKLRLAKIIRNLNLMSYNENEMKTIHDMEDL